MANSNPYIALREAKIARNEARLAQLGLLKSSASKVNIGNDTLKRSDTKRSHEKNDEKPLRRSSRLSPHLSQQSDRSSSVELQQPAFERKRRRPATLKDDNVPSSYQANSVLSVTIHVETLIFGQGGVLGRMLDQRGKEFVINTAFEIAASPEDKMRLLGARLSFNKYSGVQEWNNAIFLWVNLGSKFNLEVNEFINNCEQITWFGGSQMHDDSRAIQKLLQYGKEATSKTSKIVLWCRKYEPQSKQYTPYICLGRLSYHSHVPGSQPLSFVWNLLDSGTLKNHQDSALREQFQALITL